MARPAARAVLGLAGLYLALLPLAACSNGSHPGQADGADAGLDAGQDAGPDADGDVVDVVDDGDDGSAISDDGDQAGDDILDGGDSGADPSPDGADEAPDGDDQTPDGGDVAADGGDEPCPDSEPFDYTCTAGQPETCPGGMCVLGLCIAPVLDEHRWDDCGNDQCDPCETLEACPADCGPWPPFSGSKVYDNDTTITVWVHGFYNKSPDEIEQMVYGQFGCGGLLAEFSNWGVQRPCGDSAPGDVAPDQLFKVEYYGAIAPDWMSAEDVAQVEQLPYDGPTALERYALIVAKAIRYKLQVSGATHVNLACHSMGCLITRHMIEHDLEGLASENRFVRWFSSAGVIAGARLARLYDNPTIQQWAPLLGLELSDFVVMHPDFVQDRTCVWDHRLWEGNSPLFKDMIIHHATATDPHVSDALGLTLLDLNNPGDEPNDGIMYTEDEYFHSQRPDVALHAPAGQVLQPSHNAVYIDHMNLPDTDAAALLATAGLFHRRKVRIRLAELELKDDREHHDAFDGEHGEPPAEISAEVEVRYNPFVLATFGKDVLVHQTSIAHRSCEMFSQDEGTTVQPDYLIYSGPLFDEMDALQLHVELLEVDWYRRMGVAEWSFDAHQQLYDFDESVPLVDGSIERRNDYVRLRLQVEVIDQY